MSDSPEEELGKLRREIDQADRDIVRIILRRAEVAAKIGASKRADGSPVYRPDREREVYRNVAKIAGELYPDSAPLPVEVLENIYREIMSGSIAVEKGPAIAFMGPLASFSHLACRKRFGSSLREHPVGSIPEVFRVVESGRDATYGIVPVDNTTEGSVGPTLDMLLKTDLKIYAEQYIRVHMTIQHHEEIPFGEIRKIYTNKIAFEQCRNWIQQNLSMADMEIVETASTARAARMAAERKDGAAIASELAAETYGLKILKEDIQDSSANMTRFLIIGRDQSKPTGDDKTSIICSTNDRPGSLYGLLRPFHDAGINLTRIESRASRRSYGDYNFFIDFEGHHSSPEIEQILKITAGGTSFLKLLGSYPRTDKP